jgi:hypothetical protein
VLQSRRSCTSPTRQMMLQSQQQQQQQQPAGGWSYPRGREQRVRTSREGSPGPFGFGGSRSRSPGALQTCPPDMYTRARSTSPSLGMHYLEKGAGSGGKGRASSTRNSFAASSVCSGSVAALRGTGGSLPCAVGTSSSSSSFGSAAGLAEDPRFTAACKVGRPERVSSTCLRFGCSNLCCFARGQHIFVSARSAW